MKFKEAIERCAVRSSIFRVNDKWKISPGGTTSTGIVLPTKGSRILKQYGFNHNISLYDRVPIEDQKMDDWEEYDPRDDHTGSLVAYND